MKIAIITDYHNKTWIWSQNYNLYIWLRRLWIDVDIINLVSPQWFKDIPWYGINIISPFSRCVQLSFGYGVMYKFPKSLKKVFRENSYDAVILWHQGLAYLYPILIKFSFSLSIIVDDLFPLYESLYSGLSFYIYNHILLSHLKDYKNLIFISDFTKFDYVKYYGNLDIKRNKTIYIWIDKINISDIVKDTLINKLWLDWKNIILNVWSEDPRKNIKMFLELARHYKGSKDMIFIRVGRKSQQSIAYINQYNLDNVLYVSGLSEEELMWLYEISNIVLSPSLLEGYGKQIFEWYLYHNFVISTKVSDVEPIFKADPCVFIINDPMLIDEYVQSIDTICKNNLTFHYSTEIQSLEKEAQEYLDFLKSI